MVTAILPSMTISRKTSNPEIPEPNSTNNGHTMSPSISSELTITQQRHQHHSARQTENTQELSSDASPARLAGFVGFFTGCGALLALGLFLPLPALLRSHGTDPLSAVRHSFYIIGIIALVVAALCLVGLQDIPNAKAEGRNNVHRGNDSPQITSSRSLIDAFVLGVTNPTLTLAYFGGFVARASSVGITLFIPLYANAYFVSTGRCDNSAGSPEAIKEHCRRAYVLAAELSGVSQLVALVFAPVFGYVADRFPKFYVPLLTAAAVGIVGYAGLATVRSPDFRDDGNLWIFILMAMLGISQIGAIVCSLGLLGRCILENKPVSEPGKDDPPIENAERASETTGLLKDASSIRQTRQHLQGSIAGVYSFAGGAGILLLTKLGGYLFDMWSPSAPFVMLSAFNGLLLLVGLGCSLAEGFRAD